MFIARALVTLERLSCSAVQWVDDQGHPPASFLFFFASLLLLLLWGVHCAVQQHAAGCWVSASSRRTCEGEGEEDGRWMGEGQEKAKKKKNKKRREVVNACLHLSPAAAAPLEWNHHQSSAHYHMVRSPLGYHRLLVAGTGVPLDWLCRRCCCCFCTKRKEGRKEEEAKKNKLMVSTWYLCAVCSNVEKLTGNIQ